MNSTEHTFASPVELEPGILRVTLPLPSGPKHVHCYLLRGDDGWTLVDTGLGLPDPPWEKVVAGLDAPIVRIFITHMHPDHVGGAAPAAEATGAPVLQGRVDYEQCERVWGQPNWPRTIADWFLRQGVPTDVAEELLQSGHVFADFVRFAWNPQPVEPGDDIDGWRVLALPGHADGHLALLREEDGVLIAGDSILTPITPAIGLWPDSRPDPLGDYLETLRVLGEIAPRIAYTGHNDPVPDVAQRAVEIAAHHDERLDKTEASLSAEPQSGFEVSHAIFGSALPPIQRRFAVAEALSHLEWLVRHDRARRHEDDRGVSYTARQPGG